MFSPQSSCAVTARIDGPDDDEFPKQIAQSHIRLQLFHLGNNPFFIVNTHATR